MADGTQVVDVGPRAVELIEKLAAKLGITVDQLWPVMVRQAKIAAITEAIILLLLGGALFSAFRFVQHKTTPHEITAGSGYVTSDWEGEGKGLAWIGLGVCAIVYMVCFAASLSTITTAILNPQYWALEKILESVK